MGNKALLASVMGMGRQELIMTYPPESWKCPGCGHEHSKAHYSVEGQIDYDKKPGESGRILFNRRNKNDQLASDTPIDHSKPMKGEQFDEGGVQRGLYCSHCGYEDELVVVTRVGDLPSLPDRFFATTKFKSIPKSWKRLLDRFVRYLKELGKI